MGAWVEWGDGVYLCDRFWVTDAGELWARNGHTDVLLSRLKPMDGGFGWAVTEVAWQIEHIKGVKKIAFPSHLIESEGPVADI